MDGTIQFHVVLWVLDASIST